MIGDRVRIYPRGIKVPQENGSTWMALVHIRDDEDFDDTD